jgi:hypothetical protein
MMAGTPVEIPLTPSQNQEFDILLGTQSYHLTLIYNDQMDGGWYMDIADNLGNPLADGIPLVTGADLLAQYPDLAIPGTLTVQTDHDILAPPTFDNLGINSHLYFTPND